jgi:uncharacterized protein YjiS (DUF1127 family)
MPFESPSPGDIVPTHARPGHRRDAKIFQIVGRSQSGHDGRLIDRQGPHPYPPAAGEPSSRRTGTAQHPSDADSGWRAAAAISRMIAPFLHGFALYAAAVHPPEYFGLSSEPPAHDDPASEPAARTHLPRWSGWTRSLAKLRSGLVRRFKIRRTMVHWQALDDRMLKDIGLTRHEIDRFVRYGRRRI